MQLSPPRAHRATQVSLVAFTVGAVRYAIHIAEVREIVTPASLTILPHMPEGIAGVADHRSEVVPIIDMRTRFGLPPSERPKKIKWVLVGVAGRTIGLIVDDVVGVVRIHSGDFRGPPDLGSGRQVQGIVSVTTHDGKLLFVLDLSELEVLASQIPQSSPAGASPDEDADRVDRS